MKTSNRWKTIYHNSKGAYFVQAKTRWYLSEFMALVDSLNNEWHGHMSISNTCGMLIKISNDGEKVKTCLVY